MNIIRHILLRELKEKGYQVINGEVISPFGNKLSLQKRRDRYVIFSHRMKNGITRATQVHRFVAYLKYGDKIFDPTLQVRHLDGNPQNNNEDNIVLGTPSENAMDKPRNVRIKSALIATSHVKIHDHKAIIERRKEGATYKQLMDEFEITSKGTISWIINSCLLTCGGTPADTASCLDVAEKGNS
jgi:hypothetical protein